VGITLSCMWPVKDPRLDETNAVDSGSPLRHSIATEMGAAAMLTPASSKVTVSSNDDDDAVVPLTRLGGAWSVAAGEASKHMGSLKPTGAGLGPGLNQPACKLASMVA
jgi:hypothetical protein